MVEPVDFVVALADFFGQAQVAALQRSDRVLHHARRDDGHPLDRLLQGQVGVARKALRGYPVGGLFDDLDSYELPSYGLLEGGPEPCASAWYPQPDDVVACQVV